MANPDQPVTAPATGDGGKPEDAATGDKTSDGGEGSAPAPVPALSPEKTFTAAELEKATKRAVQDALKKANLTEDERRKAEVEELKLQVRTRDLRDAVLESAQSANAKNPKAIYKLIKDDIEFDDKGKATNIAEAMKQVQLDFPEQFETAATAASGGDKTTAPAQKKTSIDGGAGKDSATLTAEQEVTKQFQQTGRRNSFRL